MSDVRAEFNPFQAPPSSHEIPQANELGDDDEFLILRKQILCREQVELPKVCVFFGDTEDLEPRRKTLKTLKPLSAVVAVLLGVSVLFVPALIIESNRGPLSGWVADALKMTFYVVLAVGAGVMIWKQGCYKVDATWYVGRRYRRRLAIERRIGQVILVGSAVLLLLGVPYVEYELRIGFIVLAVGSLIASLKLDCERSLTLKEKRNEAFVLEGHKKRFFETVNRLRSGF